MPRRAGGRGARGCWPRGLHTGRYAEALRELRTVRRLSGSSEHLPIMADCERGLGRPERALALARERGRRAGPRRTGRARDRAGRCSAGPRGTGGSPRGPGRPGGSGASGGLAERLAVVRVDALQAAGRAAEASVLRAALPETDPRGRSRGRRRGGRRGGRRRGGRRVNGGLSARTTALAERYDLALVDLDGVAYKGVSPIPHAADGLPGRGRRGWRWCSSPTTRHASRIRRRPALRPGDRMLADDVVTAAQAAAELLSRRLEPASRVLVVGGPGW